MKIINMHDTKFNPSTMIRIDRPYKYGNPFKMTSECDRLTVIWKYALYILDQPELLEGIERFQDKTCSCWCSPLPCHGNVLEYLSENPHVIARYQGGNLTKEQIAENIFKVNGWNVPKVSKQVTLF